MDEDPVHVLYIGGFGRSGSTILDGVLGEVDGLVSAGELRCLWRRGVLDDQLCGCEEPLTECPFWTEVMEEAFGGFDEAVGEEYEALIPKVDRVRRLPWLLGPGSPPGYRGNLERFLEIRRRVYRGILAAAEADVVVDSSKIPSTPYLLQADPGIRTTTIHLVRDPRAVANSWQRRKRWKGIHDREVYLPQATPAKAARSWVLHNVFMEPHAWRGGGHVRVRYEDFARDPGTAVERILEAASLDRASPLDGSTVTMRENHTCAGNPGRFRSGEVEIRLDDAWRDEVDARTWFTVTGVTGPMLRAYGYELAAGAPGR